MSNQKLLGTYEVGLRLGMSQEWVRRQCVALKMPSIVYRTGSRSVYRITEEGLAEFQRRYARSPGDFDG